MSGPDIHRPPPARLSSLSRNVAVVPYASDTRHAVALNLPLQSRTKRRGATARLCGKASPSAPDSLPCQQLPPRFARPADRCSARFAGVWTTLHRAEKVVCRPCGAGKGGTAPARRLATHATCQSASPAQLSKTLKRPPSAQLPRADCPRALVSLFPRLRQPLHPIPSCGSSPLRSLSRCSQVTH